MTTISDSLIRKAGFFAQIDQDSPLEFYIGVDEFRKQNFSESAGLLELVLEKFPDHHSAKILLSRVYAELEKYQQALAILRSVCNQIHSSKTLDYYLKQIEITSQIELPEDTRNVSLEYELKSPESSFGNAIISDQSELSNFIASETLAKIYISQGEFGEAIDVYEQLIARRPENKENYLQRIEELKARLEK